MVYVPVADSLEVTRQDNQLSPSPSAFVLFWVPYLHAFALCSPRGLLTGLWPGDRRYDMYSCIRWDERYLRHTHTMVRIVLERRRDQLFRVVFVLAACFFLPEQTYETAMKDMPWKGIVHSNATVANLIRKAEIRVLPAVIVVDDKVG